MVSIHDPIHGTIDIGPAEIKLIDSRPMQRLRHIKQLGFADMAFPGATHTRYAHSLGAMQMATRMVDRILEDLALPAAEHRRLRQMVRLAVVFHDLGHPPMSHVSERVMPPVGELSLGEWVSDTARQATHEDYTIKLLVDSELTALIEKYFGDQGVTGARLAALVIGQPPPGDPDAFVVDGRDLLPLLNQIVSSEMDADRMDYLRRDAYYCGVSYGTFDHVWLTQNLTALEHDGKLGMGLLHKGVWAFENFLLARYHMFLAVYYHHTAICFDHMLGRFFANGHYALPGDSDRYLQTDDIDLTAALRGSDDPWAELIVRRKPYRLLVETHDFGTDSRHAGLPERLQDAGIDHFHVRSKGVLSKYFKRRNEVFPLLVLEPELGRVSRIEEYTPLYRRFEDVVGLSRIYCHPEQTADARALLNG